MISERLLALGLARLALGFALAAGAADSDAAFARRAAERCATARTRFQAQTNDLEAAWRLGQATFDLAEFATVSREREALALEGVRVCQGVLARHPDQIAAHYYLGMNLGQLARSRPFSALKLVREMERTFLKARQLDAAFDHAGPDRNLGMLYLEAPGWPTSIGSRDKARQHLLRAAALAPDYPGNRLNLADAALRWEDTGLLRQELPELRRLFANLDTRFSGPDWEASRAEWRTRWTVLLKGIQEAGLQVEPARSPD